MPGDAGRYLIFPTAAGFCGIAWRGAGITGLALPAAAATVERALRGTAPRAKAGAPPPHVADAAARVARYFEGEPVDFADVPLDLGGIDALDRTIYAAARAVGWGRTTTYGELAALCGAGPDGARAVGRTMARNRAPLIVPCHRVLAAGGRLGGFSAPGGTAAKRRMLALERATFQPPGADQASFRF